VYHCNHTVRKSIQISIKNFNDKFNKNFTFVLLLKQYSAQFSCELTVLKIIKVDKTKIKKNNFIIFEEKIE
jgi:hypothetical protein